MTQRKRTTSHREIQRWIAERGGRPSVVRSSWDGTNGTPRIDFGDEKEEVEEVPWPDFFRVLDNQRLEFVYEENTDAGEQSRFSSFIERGQKETGTL